VFDKDSFPDANFNNAINKGEKRTPPIHCAWSNEAFELWYLLHFGYYDASLSRHQYITMLEGLIVQHSGEKGFRYQKNSHNMYDILAQFGSQAKAIAHARRLRESYGSDKSYAKQNPCTRVDLLVETLLSMATNQR